MLARRILNYRGEMLRRGKARTRIKDHAAVRIRCKRARAADGDQRLTDVSEEAIGSDGLRVVLDHDLAGFLQAGAGNCRGGETALVSDRGGCEQESDRDHIA